MSDCLSKWCLPNQSSRFATKMGQKSDSEIEMVWLDSTPNLTLEMLKLSKSPVVATIVHGNATLKELRKQLRIIQEMLNI